MFEQLSHVAKWRVIMAKTASYNRSGANCLPSLQLTDTNGETVRSEQHITLHHARHHVTEHCITSHYTTPHHTTSLCTISDRITLRFTMPDHTTTHYTSLCWPEFVLCLYSVCTVFRTCVWPTNWSGSALRSGHMTKMMNRQRSRTRCVHRVGQN